MSGKLVGALLERDLPPHEMLIGVAYAQHGNDRGGAIFPSIGLIAWETGRSPRTVQRVTRSFEERGLLVKVRSAAGRRANEYRMDVEAIPSKPIYVSRKAARGDTHDTPTDDPEVTPVTRTGDTDDARGDTGDALGVTPVSPKPSGNLHRNLQGIPSRAGVTVSNKDELEHTLIELTDTYRSASTQAQRDRVARHMLRVEEQLVDKAVAA